MTVWTKTLAGYFDQGDDDWCDDEYEDEYDDEYDDGCDDEYDDGCDDNNICDDDPTVTGRELATGPEAWKKKTQVFPSTIYNWFGKLTFFPWTFTTTMLTFDKERQDEENLTNFDKTKTDTELGGW